MAREQRRLAAIVAADVAGYSRLMGRDESGTLARLKEHRRERLEPALARNSGRLVKLTGDGALMEFGSAVDALRAAIEFQQAVSDANCGRSDEHRIEFRIGVHVGDLIVDGDDLYGDAVNIAARLETEATPGGIIVSRSVREAVEGRLDAKLHALGELALKNIDRPVRAFRVEWDEGAWRVEVPAEQPTSATSSAMALTLPDMPSIAVLPFQNISGDPEQEYFADGIVEDIITGLSRTRGLFVIARNSSFAYKGRSPDVRVVGRELGVRYVLEGSVRKAGSRVRITAQLVEAANGGHLWADRFEASLDDIFALQDQITSSVIGGIAPSLHTAEIERVNRKIGNLQAYDCYLRCLAATYRYSPEANEEALSYGRQAVLLDADFSLAHLAIGYALLQRWTFRWSVDRIADRHEIEQTIRRALDLDQQDARILAFCGHAMIVILGRIEEGSGLLDEAVTLDPNSAIAWRLHANAQIVRNAPEKAINDLERVLRLSPLDVGKWYTLTLMARAYNLCDRYEEARSSAAAALSIRPNFPNAVIEHIVANVLADRLDAARESLAAFRKIQPQERLSSYRPVYLPASRIARYQEALRVAGLPE